MTRLDATPIALNSSQADTAQGAGILLALAAEGRAPEWGQLLPSGPVVQGRDGRSWKLPDPQRLVTAFNAHRGPLAIDWEHAQDRRAEKGEEAPAAGWIEAVEIRNGEIWGRIDWTPRAATAIAAREYRFLSPAINYDPKTGEIVAIAGAGLVNRPNFVMAALNSQEPPMLKEILIALGLAETATAADAVTAINTLKTEKATALNAAQTPSLQHYVPRADYDTVLARATNAEKTIADGAKAEQEAEIGRELDAAVKAGKIAPASRDFYLATCRQEGGLAAFKTFVAAQPSVFTAATLVNPQHQGAATALNAEQKDTARILGLDEKAFAEHLAKQATA